MKPRALRILSALLAVVIHAAILAPAWLGPDTLQGGMGGEPAAGADMVVSLARQPPRPEPRPVTETPTPKKEAPEALKTERQPEEKKPVEEAPPEKPVERRQERKRKAGDGRQAGAGAHARGHDENAWNRYLGKLRREVERHKTYPRRARLRREEGEVQVRFRIDHRGRVTEVALVRGSGSAVLDRHVESLMAGLEFPPPPESIRVAGKSITLPVRFSLY